LNYLEFEAAAFTNKDLAQLHVMAACHLLTSVQTRYSVTERTFQYAANTIPHRGPFVKLGKPVQWATHWNGLPQTSRPGHCRAGLRLTSTWAGARMAHHPTDRDG
jgi:hypothetical protein